MDANLIYNARSRLVKKDLPTLHFKFEKIRVLFFSSFIGSLYYFVSVCLLTHSRVSNILFTNCHLLK